MDVVKVVGDRHVSVVPAVPVRTARVVGALVAADQQNSDATGIERKQNSDPPGHAQFLHVGMSRLMNLVDHNVISGSRVGWLLPLVGRRQRTVPAGNQTKADLLITALAGGGSSKTAMVELIGWLSHPTDAMLDGILGMIVAGRR